jgi:hypothetical protein
MAAQGVVSIQVSRVSVWGARTFMSAPGTRISNRVAAGGTEGGLMMRTLAARESYPYVTAFGAQNASPPTRRL